MPPFTSTSAWQSLLRHRDALAATPLSQLWQDDPGRGAALTFSSAGVAIDLAKQKVTPATLELLVALARECELPAAIDRLFTGEVVNVTEKRPALHTALRGDEHVKVGDVDVLPEVARQRERMRVFSEAVRANLWKGATAEPFTHVLAIGIGGSALGPRLAIDALRAEADGPEVRFIANIDAAEFDDAIRGLDPARTLVVVASKTYTTQETMVNAIAAREWIRSALGDEAIAKHIVASTANTRAAVTWGLSECNIFPFGDWVGGRYSLWSSVGLSIAIAVGMPRFEEMLAGAHAADLAFRSDPLERN